MGGPVHGDGQRRAHAQLGGLDRQPRAVRPGAQVPRERGRGLPLVLRLAGQRVPPAGRDLVLRRLPGRADRGPRLVRRPDGRAGGVPRQGPGGEPHQVVDRPDARSAVRQPAGAGTNPPEVRDLWLPIIEQRERGPRALRPRPLLRPGLPHAQRPGLRRERLGPEVLRGDRRGLGAQRGHPDGVGGGRPRPTR